MHSQVGGRVPRWRKKLARDLPHSIKRLRGTDNVEGAGAVDVDDDMNTDDAGFTRAVQTRDQGTACRMKLKSDNAVSSQ